MAEGRDRKEWDRTALICHTIAGALGGSKRSLSSFHRYHKGSGDSTGGVRLDVTKESDMDLLAMAMVPKYREHRERIKHAKCG